GFRASIYHFTVPGRSRGTASGGASSGEIDGEPQTYPNQSDDGSGFDSTETIRKFAGYYGVGNGELALKALKQESGGHQYGRGGRVLTSNKGAQGLMPRPDGMIPTLEARHMSDQGMAR